MKRDTIFALLIISFIMMFFYVAIWTCEFSLSEKLLFNGFLIIGHIKLFTEILDIDI